MNYSHCFPHVHHHLPFPLNKDISNRVCSHNFSPTSHSTNEGNVLKADKPSILLLLFFGLFASLSLSLFHIIFVFFFQFLLLNSWKLHCTGVYGTQGINLFLRTERKILNYQQLKLRQLFSPIEELNCQRCKQYQSRILHPRSIGSVLL